jgi:cation diffusion facilitator family transporter
LSSTAIPIADRPKGGAKGGQERTARLSVGAAIFLVCVKLATGVITGSLAFVAEAAHSATDLVAALLTLFAVRVAVRPADEEHQYGHGKAEHLAALGESAFLGLVSLAIGFQAVYRLVEGTFHQIDVTWWSITVIVLVMAVDASRALVSLRGSRRHGSAALAANALHFGSDLLGSFAVLIGLIFVSAGHESADPIAALVVAVLVVLAALRLGRQSVDVLMDRSSAESDEAIRSALTEVDENFSVRRVRARHAGGNHFVDLVVGIPVDAQITQAHAAADDIEAAVRANLPNTDVMVHLEPMEGEGSLRERATAAALSVPEVREVHNVRVLRTEGTYELTLHAKVPGSQTLSQAHHTADRVEASIHEALPELARIDTHIEPLSETAEASKPARTEVMADREAIDELVRHHTGAAPLDVSFRDAGQGRVAIITVALPAEESLREAHRRAGRIEEELRERRPDLADAVVHTEPADGG